MKKTVAVLLSLIIAVAVLVPVRADNSYTDYSANLLASYSPRDVVNLFPEASKRLAEQLRAFNKDISFSDLNLDVKYIDDLYKSVLCENPDLFFVNPTDFETTSSLSDDKLISLRPYYLYDENSTKARQEKLEASAEYFLKGVNPQWDDFDKIRYLHDIVAHYVEYETDETNTAKEIFTAYGALVQHKAVCEGYTLAYNYLLSKLGITAYYIQNSSFTHAWSMVILDGEAYHVDVTQDDAWYDNLGRVNHYYCLVSDEALLAIDDDDHTKWVSPRKAGSKTYDNAWWRQINTMIYKIGKYDFYINQHYGSSVYAGLKCRNSETGVNTTNAVLTTRWYVKDIEGAFWDRAYSYVTYDGKYLYFNDAEKVYRQTPGSDIYFTVYTKPSTQKNDIYGIAFKPDGYLYITIKTEAAKPDKIYKLNVEANQVYEFKDPENLVPEPSETETEPEETTPTYPDAPTEPGQSETEATQPITLPNTTEPTEYVRPVQTEKKKLSLYVAQKCTIVTKNAGKVKFSTNKKSVATVSKKGVITAKKAGKAVITAVGQYLTSKITVTVKNPKLSATSVTLKKGKTKKIKIIGGTGKISFKSSNKKIVAISSTGKIVAKKKGKATITVTTNGGVKLKCKVKVS